MVLIPSQMGRHNKRALLDHLRRAGTASRAELAKSLGLSQPTAGKIADELIELGVFEEVEEPVLDGVNARVGRPARMIRLIQSRARFIGLQLGVENTSLTLLPLAAGDEKKCDVQFKTPDNLKDWLRGLQKAAAQISQKSLWGILISAPGLVDERTGDVLYSPNLHWMEKNNFISLVQNIWRAPAILIQEERALALGHHAANPEDKDFFLVDFAEGVGGAVMIDGKLYSHPLPLSGELGHTPVVGNDRRCGCGAVGCLETLTSKRGLLKSFAAASPKSSRTWEAFSKSIESRGVAPWLGETLDATAAVIAGVLNVLGIRTVVITGTMAELPSEVFSRLSAAIVKGALWARFGDVKVCQAPRRRNTGLIAAGIDRLVIPMDDSNGKIFTNQNSKNRFNS